MTRNKHYIYRIHIYFIGRYIICSSAVQGRRLQISLPGLSEALSGTRVCAQTPAGKAGVAGKDVVGYGPWLVGVAESACLFFFFLGGGGGGYRISHRRIHVSILQMGCCLLRMYHYMI